MKTGFVGALRIVLILVAVMIALPAFVTGAELAHALGTRRGIWAAFGGGALLAVVAGLAGAAGARARASTYELIRQAFGHRGARVVNAALGATLIGWYGVVATLFGDALRSVLPAGAGNVPTWMLVVAGCALTTFTAMAGFKALDRLSALTTPLKLALLLWAFLRAIEGGLGPVMAYQPASAVPLGTGISMVAGGLIVGAVLSPDVCRLATTPARAAWACVVAYGLAFPAVLLLAGLPSIATHERDIVKLMLALGLGWPAMLTVVLAAWSTNSFNLYSTSLVGVSLWPGAPSGRIALAAGAAGTLLGLAGVSQALVPYLVWLSIGIPPIAGVYLVHAWLCGAATPSPPGVRWRAFVSWAVGSGWAALDPILGWSISPVPALDALALSALAHAALLTATASVRSGFNAKTSRARPRRTPRSRASGSGERP